MYRIGQEEIDAVTKVLKSGWAFKSGGPNPSETVQFEKELSEKAESEYWHLLSLLSRQAQEALSLLADGDAAKSRQVLSIKDEITDLVVKYGASYKIVNAECVITSYPARLAYTGKRSGSGKLNALVPFKISAVIFFAALHFFLIHPQII